MDENSSDNAAPDDPTANQPLRDFDSLMGDNTLTPDSLQAELNKYAEAFKQEYELNSAADPSQVHEYTKDFFRKNVHSAAAQIVWLANSAESESVRMNASKYIVEAALAEGDAAGDPIKDLLNRLTKNDASPDADSKYRSV
jgi:hypothetical protein